MEYCHENCMGCNYYPKTIDKKQCPTYKARVKLARHSLYLMKKAAKERVR